MGHATDTSIMTQLMQDAAMADREPRVHNIVRAGEVVPQGDCNLHRVASIESRSELEQALQQEWPDLVLGGVGEETTDLQLVPGTTPGSRHTIRAADAAILTIYSPADDASDLVGPLIVASGRFVVEHPEHASHSLPAGTWQVIYQRDYGVEMMARVAD